MEQRRNSFRLAIHPSELMPTFLALLMSGKTDKPAFRTFHCDWKPLSSIQLKFPQHLNKFMRVKKAFAGRIPALINLMGFIGCFPNRRGHQIRLAIPATLLLLSLS